MAATSREPFGRGSWMSARGKRVPPVRFEFETGLAAQAEIRDLLQALRRLTQRPCRQQATVTQSAHTVDDTDFVITRETIMLQAIVGDDNVNPVFDEHPGSPDAIGIDDDRAARAAREQYRLIADHCSVAVRLDALYLAQHATKRELVGQRQFERHQFTRLRRVFAQDQRATRRMHIGIDFHSLAVVRS